MRMIKSRRELGIVILMDIPHVMPLCRFGIPIYLEFQLRYTNRVAWYVVF